MSVNNKLIDIEKLSRYHENLKEVLNTKEAAGEAAKAEAAAKKYADEEIAKLSFDEAGSAAEAYDAAKDYADGLATNYDAAGTAAGFNTAMDERVVKLEAIDHDKLVADAIAAVVADADSDFDTLKEVADWIANDKDGAAALQIAVSEHGDAIEDLENTKQDNITDLETIRTGAAAGAVAEQNAKTYAKDYADGLAGNYDAAGSAAGAQAAAEATAKAYADAEIVKVNANIEENERVTAESLTDLDTRVKDLKDTTYNKTEIDTMVENVIVVASNEEIDNLFN